MTIVPTRKKSLEILRQKQRYNIWRNSSIEICWSVKLVYEAFQKWILKNKATSANWSVLVICFHDLKKIIKPTTLWNVWSMLKKTLNAKDCIDVNKYLNLKSFLKNNAKGYKPTKSFILDWHQITKFMNDAPDLIYLAFKVCTHISLDYLCYT